MNDIKTIRVPNLLALDESITYKLIKSEYPKCMKNCNHYKCTGKCDGCNNYEYDTFWKEDRNWKGIKRYEG